MKSTCQRTRPEGSLLLRIVAIFVLQRFNTLRFAGQVRPEFPVEAWISRGHFKPENPVETGKARKFTYEDSVVLGAVAEFSRLGLSPAVVSMHTAQLRFRDGHGALFVISTAFRQVSATEANPDIEGEIDITSGSIVGTAEVASIVADPKVRAFAAVNLAQLEHRVRELLGVA